MAQICPQNCAASNVLDGPAPAYEALAEIVEMLRVWDVDMLRNFSLSVQEITINEVFSEQRKLPAVQLPYFSVLRKQ
jgi:hypothetical protein